MVIRLECDKLKNLMGNSGGLSLYKHAWERSCYKNVFSAVSIHCDSIELPCVTMNSGVVASYKFLLHVLEND